MLSETGTQQGMEEAMSAAEAIEIRAMRPGEDAEAFRTLNEEWIVRHFALEAKDVETLTDPEGMILRKGGQIFMVTAGEEAVGCVALIPMGGDIYELSKMAIAPRMRGQGLGRRLLEHAIAQARLMGAKGLVLGSSKKLGNAVHLYETTGFKHVSPDKWPPSPYVRADVYMEMAL